MKLKLIAIIQQKQKCPTSFLKRFYTEEVPQKSSTSIKKKILDSYIKIFFVNKDVSDSLKGLAIELLVLPILTEVFSRDDINNSEVLDNESIK